MMSTATRETRPIASYRVRLKNRRIIGGLMHDGTICWRFVRLAENRTREVQRIRLSQEAVEAMCCLLLKVRSLHPIDRKAAK